MGKPRRAAIKAPTPSPPLPPLRNNDPACKKPTRESSTPPLQREWLNLPLMAWSKARPLRASSSGKKLLDISSGLFYVITFQPHNAFVFAEPC
jgi:hypothetical protein